MIHVSTEEELVRNVTVSGDVEYEPDDPGVGIEAHFYATRLEVRDKDTNQVLKLSMEEREEFEARLCQIAEQKRIDDRDTAEVENYLDRRAEGRV